MRIFYIFGGIITFLLIISGVYFFVNGDESNDLVTQKNQLQEDLIIAKSKLNKERETLDVMMSDLSNLYPLAFSTQEQMKKVTSIVEETDYMFNNVKGSNPELKVKNPLADIDINNQRKDINKLLALWRAGIDILSINKIDINESKKIEEQMQTVKNFIENLSKIVENLNTEDSGLSQFQIDTFFSQLPSVDEINEVLISLETAIEISETSNSSTNTQTFLNPNTPPVTPEDVIAKQSVVIEMQSEVEIIQEQLNQVDQQIEEIPPSPTPPTPVPVDNNSNPNIPIQNTNDPNNTGTVSPPQGTNYQGIIIQPGPPRLIQGTDPF